MSSVSLSLVGCFLHAYKQKRKILPGEDCIYNILKEKHVFHEESG